MGLNDPLFTDKTSDLFEETALNFYSLKFKNEDVNHELFVYFVFSITVRHTYEKTM